MNDPDPGDGLIVSRRSFLKSFGTTAAAAATAQVEVVAQELQKANAEKTYGPEAVPITPAQRKSVIVPRVAPALCYWTERRFIPAASWPSKLRAARSPRSRAWP